MERPHRLLVHTAPSTQSGCRGGGGVSFSICNISGFDIYLVLESTLFVHSNYAVKY
jgi:hypothetical protein